jgi:membrane protease YdiL (CAAX protease family)
VIDYRAALAGRPNNRALPGATSASTATVVIASLGALLILVAETGGEYVLGLSAEQSRMTVLFGLYSILAAPVMEEIVFRGYLVIEHRGPAERWAGVVLASLLFGILHPFLWQWHGDGLTVHLGAKAWFSTAMVIAVSLCSTRCASSG